MSEASGISNRTAITITSLLCVTVIIVVCILCFNYYMNWKLLIDGGYQQEPIRYEVISGYRWQKITPANKQAEKK